MSHLKPALAVMAAFMLPSAASAQQGPGVYFDGGSNASMNSAFEVTDNGKLMTFDQGGTWTTSLSSFGRNGVTEPKNSIYIETSGNTGANQRCEHNLPGDYRNPEHIGWGGRRYVAFSFRLAYGFPDGSTTWCNLFQMKQETSGNSGYPVVQLGFFGGSSKLKIQSRHGVAGNASVTGSFKEMFVPKRGQWYDVIIGYQLNPWSNGWVNCWIKESGQTNYTQYQVPTDRVGYSAVVPHVYHRIGLYHGTDGRNRAVHFDEFRYGNYKSAVEIPY